MATSAILRCSHAPFFRFALAGSVGILGRSGQCDFVVDDLSVSRKHAAIGIQESRLRVTDLGSRNGTFVDDLRIQTSELRSGQVVCFGSVPFLITVQDLPVPFDVEEETDNPRDAPANVAVSNLETLEPLSAAQRKVFDLLLTGKAEKTIAKRLQLSQHTVHNHVRAIFHTFAVHSRAELFAVILHKGR
jgi:DNA-binding CsgD family transcriptional regulator